MWSDSQQPGAWENRFPMKALTQFTQYLNVLFFNFDLLILSLFSLPHAPSPAKQNKENLCRQQKKEYVLRKYVSTWRNNCLCPTNLKWHLLLGLDRIKSRVWGYWPLFHIVTDGLTALLSVMHIWTSKFVEPWIFRPFWLVNL